MWRAHKIELVHAVEAHPASSSDVLPLSSSLAVGADQSVLDDLVVLKPQFGHSIGSQAPTSMSSARAPSRTQDAACVGRCGAGECARDGPTCCRSCRTPGIAATPETVTVAPFEQRMDTASNMSALVRWPIPLNENTCDVHRPRHTPPHIAATTAGHDTAIRAGGRGTVKRQEGGQGQDKRRGGGGRIAGGLE